MIDARLATQFQEARAHLQGVAYRMLGSAHEAEEAVQETWIRLQRADTSDVENLPGWLTTVLARVCLDLLRARTSRRESPVDFTVAGRQSRVQLDLIPRARLCWPTRSDQPCW